VVTLAWPGFTAAQPRSGLMSVKQYVEIDGLRGLILFLEIFEQNPVGRFLASFNLISTVLFFYVFSVRALHRA